MDKKTRGDSKLDNLPERQFLELRDGFLSRRFRTYDDALTWLDAECGVSSSPAALSGFFRRECKPIIKQRRSMAALRSEAWGEACEGDETMTPAIAERLRQFVFEVLETEAPEPKDVKSLVDAFAKVTSEGRKDKQLELDERKMALLEGKAKQADQAKDVMESQLSEEEKGAKMRAIFGM